MLLFAKQIERIYFHSEVKDLYINKVEKIDLVSIAEYVEKIDGKQRITENMYKICI